MRGDGVLDERCWMRGAGVLDERCWGAGGEVLGWVNTSYLVVHHTQR